MSGGISPHSVRTQAVGTLHGPSPETTVPPNSQAEMRKMCLKEGMDKFTDERNDADSLCTLEMQNFMTCTRFNELALNRDFYAH